MIVMYDQTGPLNYSPKDADPSISFPKTSYGPSGGNYNISSGFEDEESIDLSSLLDSLEEQFPAEDCQYIISAIRRTIR